MAMQISNLGYPRMDRERTLKKLLEAHWQGQLSEKDLLTGAAQIEQAHWDKQIEFGIDIIPVGDFSFYDHVLDTAFMFGLVPKRFQEVEGGTGSLAAYFAMARGSTNAPACAMKKWFDTNYHYIVPEWENKPYLAQNRPLQVYLRAQQTLGTKGKPVILGPFTFVKLSKNLANWRQALSELAPLYAQLLRELDEAGVTWVQIDEPALVTDMTEEEAVALQETYKEITKSLTGLKIMLQTYFGSLSRYEDVITLPVDGFGLDFVQGSRDNLRYLEQNNFPAGKYLGIGIVDGRNVWQSNLRERLNLIYRIEKYVPLDRIWLQPSCSLIHLPVTTADETQLPPALHAALRFADERLAELKILARAVKHGETAVADELIASDRTQHAFEQMPGRVEPAVRTRIETLKEDDFKRSVTFVERKVQQASRLSLPLLPTTTIGSFPQTAEVRQIRARFRKGQVDEKQYRDFIRCQIAECIKIQEEIGLDVLVHGEFERNDMVEYFGNKLRGFAVTVNGWVQPYGSRGVKPPILYGDVWRDSPMTVEEITYAQSLTHDR